MNIELTDLEREYITHAIILLKDSLDDLCDENKQVRVTYITQEQADAEYKLINSILRKIAGDNNE